jgi:hypothetical protein
MNARGIGGKVKSPMSFWLVLAFPSTAVVQKFLGVTGVFVYIISSGAIIWLLTSEIIKKYILNNDVLREKNALTTLSMMIAVLGLLFLYAYPIVDAGVVGLGSDNDDALELAATELISGRYPYYMVTYLGNTLAPMPGGVILSIPFLATGMLAIQNIFWFVAYCVTAKWYLSSWRQTLLFVFTMVFLSPSFLHALVAGYDRIANVSSVLILVLTTVCSTTQGNRRWIGWVSAILLGIALSWRPNFLLIVPLVYSALIQINGWAEATRKVVVTLLAFFAVTLPFYLFDPAHFTPLQQSSKLDFPDILPHSEVIIVSLNAFLSISLALLNNSAPHRLLRNSFLVLLFPVICAVALSSIRLGYLDFSLASYGLFAMFFGSLAFWPFLFLRDPSIEGRQIDAPKSVSSGPQKAPLFPRSTFCGG